MTKSEWITEAIKTINRGVELMPLHHMAQWEGVRGLLESTDLIENDDCARCAARERFAQTAREILKGNKPEGAA